MSISRAMPVSGSMPQQIAPHAKLLLAMGLLACQQMFPGTQAAATSDSNPKNFRACVDHEAKAAIARAYKIGGVNALYGYTVDINNEVIAVCNPQLRSETLQDLIFTNDPDYLYVNTAVDNQVKRAFLDQARRDAETERRRAALEEPRLRAEKAEETEIGAAYYKCLVSHAKILSVNTNEPAEIVVQATFASCPEERQAVFDVYQRHHSFWTSESMKSFDAEFKPHLLLEVIKARARPARPVEPTAKHETPL